MAIIHQKRKTEKLYVYTDGGSRGNPGPAAIALVICNKKKILTEFKEYIGEATNNVAEYRALIKALEIAVDYCRKEIFCFSDSQLLIRQLNGQYKIKAKHLLNLFHELKNREKSFERVVYNHVRRNNKFITRADKLVNLALDEKLDDDRIR